MRANAATAEDRLRGAGRGCAIDELELSEQESLATRQWLGAPAGDPHAPDPQRFDAALRARLHLLPARLQDRLRAFADPGADAGVLRVCALPIVHGLAPTPTRLDTPIRPVTGTEPLVLAISLLLGHALSFPNMRRGDRVHNIFAVRSDEGTQKASNAVSLHMHTEMAFQDGGPEALVLLCLRAGENPPATQFCDLGRQWSKLDAASQSLLMEPAFGFPRRGDTSGAADIAHPQPMAMATPQGVSMRYDCAAHGATVAHDAALQAFRHQVDAATSALTLSAGDLLVIDNRRIAHGRDAYGPRYDGSDRWLQRCLIRLDTARAGGNH